MKWMTAGKLMISLIFLTVLCACGRQNREEDGIAYKIYYVNRDETAVIPYDYVTQTTVREELVEELLTQLGKVSEKLEYKAPLAAEYTLLDYTISEEQLTLIFDTNYRDQPITTEVLMRAAMVRTLTQVEGISYVAFQINSEPLTDAMGGVIGLMSADQFIDNTGNEINTYEKAKLTLYLANEGGDRLKTVNRSVVYLSNIPMERLVVEQLISGPADNEPVFPTMNPDTKIISVNVKDGTCYVNLDSLFLSQIYPVTSEVTIYSITNSLVELSNINRVQISINGDASVNYKENISLSTVFERNLELVE